MNCPAGQYSGSGATSCPSCGAGTYCLPGLPVVLAVREVSIQVLRLVVVALVLLVNLQVQMQAHAQIVMQVNIPVQELYVVTAQVVPRPLQAQVLAIIV